MNHALTLFRTGSNEDTQRRDSKTTRTKGRRSPTRFSRVFKRHATKSPAERKGNSSTRKASEMRERGDVGFSMYSGKNRTTAGRKRRSVKKRKRRKTRKERDAVLRAGKRNRAKRETRQHAVRSSGSFGYEIRAECVGYQGEAGIKRALRDEKRGQMGDELQRKQAELEWKRSKHNRKRDAKSSRNPQEPYPHRRSLRRSTGTPVEWPDSCCYGNERDDRWNYRMDLNTGLDYGMYRSRKSNRDGKKAASSHRESKFDYRLGQVSNFPYTAPLSINGSKPIGRTSQSPVPDLFHFWPAFCVWSTWT